MSDVERYREVFLTESADYLQQVSDGLIGLESNPGDTTRIETVFRGAHSLKGMAAAMGYVRTADLTHAVEEVMDGVRKGEVEPSPDVTGVLLAATDLVRDLIADESSGGTAVQIEEMLSALRSIRGTASDGSDEMGALLEHGHNGIPPLHDGETAWHVHVTLERSCVLKAVRAYMVIKRLARMGRIIETHPTEREIEDELFDRSFEVLLASAADEDGIRTAVMHVSEVEGVETSPLVTAAPAHGEPSPIESVLAAKQLAREAPKVAHTQTVRVAIGHLDTLVDLAGELVIMRSRLDRIAAKSGSAELLETLEELHRVSSELQYEIMQTRMVPVGNIFNRFPRMVRDLSVELGKRVDFYLDGLDIELDRTVLDEIGDPLVHLLRNSLDHGVEPSEERVRLGKPSIASVRLTARRERDHVAIIVSDDGRGIDPERVWAAAVEDGLVTNAERPDHDDDAILMLACTPGFSTTEEATQVSGRGVGLDAVKGKIEYLGGTVQISSEVGVGTEFVLRLPMTLAIIQALIVEARGQSYALPLSVVDEVYDTGDVRVDTVDGTPVVILRTGEIVPLARLDALLSGADVCGLPEEGSSVVLVQSGVVRYALCVDDLGGRREIVVKPLSRLLREARGFSGATILGDGRVMLILDPRTLFSAQEG